MAVLITRRYELLGSQVFYYLAREGKKAVMFNVTSRELDQLEKVESLLIPVKGSVLDWSNLVRTFKNLKVKLKG